MTVDHGRLEAAQRRLERAWWKNGRPREHSLRPGLNQPQQDEILASEGVDIGEELRAWWAWQDGSARFGPWADDIPNVGPGGWHHSPLAEALELLRYHRELAARLLDEGDAESAARMWSASLMPFARNAAGPNTLLAIDLEPSAQGRVVLVTNMGIEPETPNLGLAEVLDAWATMLESGAYEYDDGYWQPRVETYFEAHPARALLI